MLVMRTYTGSGYSLFDASQQVERDVNTVFDKHAIEWEQVKSMQTNAYAVLQADGDAWHYYVVTFMFEFTEQTVDTLEGI
jgi:hypothetical protein